MNIKSFNKFCNFCDKILNSNKSSVFTHSITALHVLKEHPGILQQYFNIEKKKYTNKNPIKQKIFSYLLNFFNEKKNFLVNNSSKNSEVLIISNLINENHLYSKDDFYFGSLEEYLNKNNIKSYTVLRNLTNQSSSKLINKIKKNKILLTSKTFFYREIYILFYIFREYLIIKFNFKIPKIPGLKKNFLSLFSMKSMVYNLRLYYQIRELILEKKPKILILPFEGQAWERIVIKSIKDTKLDTKVVAYQFGTTTKYQHALFRPLKKDYNPDLIITSGNLLMNKFIKNYKCPVKVFGSNKYRKKKNQVKKVNKIFLVLPEGFKSETKFMLDFTLNCAKVYPNYQFIFRAHPLFLEEGSKEIIKIKKEINKYKNLNFSNMPLVNDLNYCNYVIFRGTAAVLEAVSRGLKPIYLKRKNELDFNPLHNVFQKNLVAYETSDIEKIIHYIKKNGVKSKISKYSNEFFLKPDLKKIKNILLNSDKW